MPACVVEPCAETPAQTFLFHASVLSNWHRGSSLNFGLLRVHQLEFGCSPHKLASPQCGSRCFHAWWKSKPRHKHQVEKVREFSENCTNRDQTFPKDCPRRYWFLWNLFKACEALVAMGSPPKGFAASRTVVIPKSCEVDDLGSIVRFPSALRPLTLCNCDCKVKTTATKHGLHRDSVDCIHPALRCISGRVLRRVRLCPLLLRNQFVRTAISFELESETISIRILLSSVALLLATSVGSWSCSGFELNPSFNKISSGLRWMFRVGREPDAVSEVYKWFSAPSSYGMVTREYL